MFKGNNLSFCSSCFKASTAMQSHFERSCQRHFPFIKLAAMWAEARGIALFICNNTYFCSKSQMNTHDFSEKFYVNA
jgi:hypothetical protein